MKKLKCTKCKELLSLTKFRTRKESSTGYQYWCKECEYKSNKLRYEKTHIKIIPTKESMESKLRIKQEKDKRRMLLYRYNMTLEEYNVMYEKQDKKCLICNIEFPLGTLKGLCVDHDHITNKVRALLCTSCNTLLGKIENNPAIIKNIECYISNFKLNTQ